VEGGNNHLADETAGIGFYASRKSMASNKKSEEKHFTFFTTFQNISQDTKTSKTPYN